MPHSKPFYSSDHFKYAEQHRYHKHGGEEQLVSFISRDEYSSGFIFRKLKCQKEQSRKQHLLLQVKFKVNLTLERWLTGVGSLGTGLLLT